MPAKKTFTFVGYSLKKQLMLTCTSTTKPSLNVPLKTKFREVPTKNWSAFPSATALIVPYWSGTWEKKHLWNHIKHLDWCLILEATHRAQWQNWSSPSRQEQSNYYNLEQGLTWNLPHLFVQHRHTRSYSKTITVISFQ